VAVEVALAASEAAGLAEAVASAAVVADSVAAVAVSVVAALRGAGEMPSRLQRLQMNLFDGWFQIHRRFPPELLDDMAAAIADGEHTHLGEVRFAVESRLPLQAVWMGLDASTRARQVFGQLGVWDTEHNCGVLVYVLMAEHRIEIVADRGIARRVAPEEWAAICAGMREHFAAGQWRAGALHGITEVHALLAEHFPGHGRARPDELPDRPVLL
jgi:uncharacterized membrane protein